jgi:two-component system sensor histidine kinase DegS
MALDDLGLVPTLRKYVQDFEEKTRIHSTFETIGKEIRLPSAMEAGIYRLVQEAFTNVMKHAHASHVSLKLQYQAQMVKISIQDNGAGFNTKFVEARSKNSSHFGLIGMKERVELLEGRMDIESNIGSGTLITIHIPINADNERRHK